MHIYLLITPSCVKKINKFYMIHYSSYTYFRKSRFLNANYAWHNDLTARSNSTGLKNSFKTAQKRNVEPDMATYCYNSVLCKFLNPNCAWHNDLTAQSNSTGLKKSFKTAQEMLSLIWLHTVTIVYCHWEKCKKSSCETNI